MTDVNKQEFDSAVTNSLITTISSGSCPELNQAISAIVATQTLQTNTDKPKSLPSSSSRGKGRKVRSRSRGRKGSKSRERSVSRNARSGRSRFRFSRSRSRSPHRSRRRTQSHSSSDSSRRSLSPESGQHRRRVSRERRTQKRCKALMHRYKERSFDKAGLRFEVNELQLAFNEKVVYDVHKIARISEEDHKESIRLLANLKKKILERQENIIVADSCGIRCGRFVENPHALQISKQKQKLVDAYQKRMATGGGPVNRSSSAGQPFLGQRGGQPRSFNQQRQANSGPFTNRRQDTGNGDGRPAQNACFLCHQPDHWADRCPTRYGQAAFTNRRTGPSAPIKPLFIAKQF